MATPVGPVTGDKPNALTSLSGRAAANHVAARAGNFLSAEQWQKFVGYPAVRLL
jgi:hypothetical protein